jgi:hypothetical protein
MCIFKKNGHLSEKFATSGSSLAKVVYFSNDKCEIVPDLLIQAVSLSSVELPQQGF